MQNKEERFENICKDILRESVAEVESKLAFKKSRLDQILQERRDGGDPEDTREAQERHRQCIEHLWLEECRLQKILDRADQGHLGECEACGGPIHLKRLFISHLCCSCARKEEKR